MHCLVIAIEKTWYLIAECIKLGDSFKSLINTNNRVISYVVLRGRSGDSYKMISLETFKLMSPSDRKIFLFYWIFASLNTFYFENKVYQTMQRN